MREEEEEKRRLVYIIVCLVGLLVFLIFILSFFFGGANFSLFLKFWRKNWKHLYILSVFFNKKMENGVFLFSVKW
jgi:hypothetical protein